jgi:hypothetical protein
MKAYFGWFFGWFFKTAALPLMALALAGEGLGNQPAVPLSGPGGAISQVVQGEGVYVAVGQSGSILASRDGRQWSAAHSGTAHTIYGVAQGNGLFVAVGPSTVLLTSNNGFDWVHRTSPQTPVAEQARLHNRFGTGSNLHDFCGLRSIAFGQGLFAAVGRNGRVLTSPDGINWTSQISGTSKTLRGIVYAGGLFIAVGDHGTILTSLDAVTWSRRDAGTRRNLRTITVEHGKFGVIGRDTRLISADGIAWESAE